jgi:GNAT superfamily N-acetyltransferase
VYHAAYGDGYVHPRFYDEHEIRKMIYDDDTLMLVAEDDESGRIVGAASVLFTQGAFSDLVGEFGRLVVHPEFRGHRIGTRLMEERLARVGTRLHVAFAEVRVCNQSSPRISQRHGFVPVGALPQKLLFGDERENAGYLVKYFDGALSLRRNHPRVIPEALGLADIALDQVGITPDVVEDEDAVPYPGGRSFELEELTDQGYASLLRIERGRTRHREVFGPQRLHYGLFKLKASRSNYVIARDGARIVGAVGYMSDPTERSVRIFEVINSEEEAIRFLFEALHERFRAERMVAIEIDVSAHAPRMQRTLLEMGYLPVAYVPALAFHDVERIDVVKMYCLMEELRDLPFDAPEPTLSVGRYVLDSFARRRVLPRLVRAMDRLEICEGLSQEQTARLLGEFNTEVLFAGTEVFAQGDAPDRMLLVLSGEAAISIDGTEVGAVGAGESLGEVSLLSDTPRSATAVARTDLEVGVLTRPRLNALVRRRPDIGAVVYRNLAQGLGSKLRRADRAMRSGPIVSA